MSLIIMGTDFYASVTTHGAKPFVIISIFYNGIRQIVGNLSAFCNVSDRDIAVSTTLTILTKLCLVCLNV